MLPIPYGDLFGVGYGSTFCGSPSKLVSGTPVSEIIISAISATDVYVSGGTYEQSTDNVGVRLLKGSEKMERLLTGFEVYV